MNRSLNSWRRRLTTGVFFLLFAFTVVGQKPMADREYWLQQLDKMARPVLFHLAQGDLKKTMPVVLSKRTDNAVMRTQASYLEAFGRTLAGIAPWLQGEGGSPKEQALRNQYRAWTLDAIRHATDTAAADDLAWDAPGQALVDAAFLRMGLSVVPGYGSIWTALISGM